MAGGQIASAIAALVSVRIMTELLTPDAFGRLTLLLGAAALAVGLAATPRLQGLMRYYPEAAREEHVGTLRAVGVRLIAPLVSIAAVVIVGFWLVASSSLGDTWFTGLMVAALLTVDCMRSFELSLLSAARRQRTAALIYAADAWSRPLMAIVCVIAFGSSANAAIAGYITGSAVVVLSIHTWIRREGVLVGGAVKEIDPDTSEKLATSIRRYAWPLASLALFGWLSGVGDRYLIAGMLSLHDAGLYAAAYALASRPFLMLSGVVELTMRPVLQNAVAAGDATLVARSKAAWLLTMAAGAAFGVVCFVLLSDWIGHVLLAEQYRSATALMPWIALGYALYNMATVYTRFCYAFDDTRAVLILTVTGAATGIAVLIPAVACYALLGAAAATPLRFGIELAVAAFLARRAQIAHAEPPKR